MGHTLNSLAEKKADSRVIFHHRFVVECCEAFHVHYRNLRIILSERDFVSMAQGMADALKRWEAKGKPETSPSTHIELCRKEVALRPVDDCMYKVNLNDNLYVKNEGKIFADGAGLEDTKYIHLKIRDLRLELTIDEFNEFASTVAEAKEKLCQRSLL
jgi:hypothetical protein